MPAQEATLQQRDLDSNNEFLVHKSSEMNFLLGAFRRAVLRTLKAREFRP